MRTRRHRARAVLLAGAAAVLGAVALAAVSSAAETNVYSATVIASNIGVGTPDPLLKNGWGLTSGPGTPWWVSDNGTDRSTLYTAGGTKIGLEVTVDGGPTGTVFNSGGSTSFQVTDGVKTARSAFLFASEDGIVRGWFNGVAGNVARVGYDGSVHGAIYKGLAIATTAAGDRLYATDFHNGHVDVLDGSFQLVSVNGAYPFADPGLPAGFAPFGIQTIGDRIFVSYARQDDDAEDDVAGQGLGFVDVYDTSGNLLGRVAQRGQLNSPWGLAQAPASGFGRFSGDLLVGNFGNGQINAYEELDNGHFEYRGALRGADGEALRIDGLWALQFGKNTVNNGPATTLFFTAGPNGEANGLFGSIVAG